MPLSSAITARIEPLGDIDTLENAWRALEARADVSFFLSWDWAATVIAMAQGDLLVARVTDADGAVALGLLSPMREARHGVMRVPQLRLNEDGPHTNTTLVAEGNGLLAARGMETLAWDAFLTTLDEPGAPAWDEVIVSNAFLALEEKTRGAGRRVHRRAERGSAYVDLAALREKGVETAADYAATLGKSTRSQLTRSLKLYEARGRLTVDRAQTAADVDAYVSDMATLYSAKWRARGVDDPAKSDYLWQFHRKLINRLLEKGGVELARLSAGGAPFAFVYNFIHGDDVLFNMGGFAVEDDNRFKPGLVAHALLIADHVRAGRARYDFLAGDDRYKFNLGQQGADYVDFAIQRATPMLQLESALRAVKRRLAKD